ncbi:MAG: hypothetical protein MJ252_02660 [archaeon]|nr:hypothetical protein [archaeon]
MDTNADQSAQEVKPKKKKEIGEINRDMLVLASRGSAIVAEILRLKDYIPDIFTDPAEEKIYSDIIFDFKFFDRSNRTKYEEKIFKDQNLRQLDEDFRENNLDIIERFFQLFASIYQYITDWEKFVGQIKNHKYVQGELTNILANKDIRHIFSECIFHAGVMLLLLDKLIPGPIREKIIVFYYRYKGGETITNIQGINNLFRDTKYSSVPGAPNNCKDEKRPSKYPTEYFARTNFSLDTIEKIIGALKDSDIYDQRLAFPNEEHKSHALSNQAAILVILLFFKPDILESDSTKMREIADKFFSNHWVVSIYMGYTLDLTEYWKDFKAARKALENTLDTKELKKNRDRYRQNLFEKTKELEDAIKEGTMTEESVLTTIEHLLALDREANVCLKWYIQQSTIASKKYQEIIKDKVTKTDIINLLLNVSQFEYLLKTMFQNLLDNKDELWNSDKAKGKQKIEELIAHFEGNNVFDKEMKREDMAEHFKKQLTRLEGLTYKNPNATERKLKKIYSEIDSIESYDPISRNASASQNVKIIKECLNHMTRIVQVRKSYLVSITKISDFAYAWINMQEYATEMQNMIKNDSKIVLKLRAVFVKIASILNYPLVRLFEIESDDIESVTNYYSGELVNFVKNILQIIPTSVFSILKDVVKVFETGFEEITNTANPIKKKDLENFAQTTQRDALAKCTFEICQFTQGILLMEKTLMGVIEVDPKIILEDGIRKELIESLAQNFHQYIDFPSTEKHSKVEEQLKKLIDIMKWHKKSFLYNQDYMNIDGRQIWCEEMHRLMNKYVELEANKFLQRKIKPKKGESEIGGKNYNIPHYPALKNSPESITFLGRLARHILYLTSPKYSVFYPMNFAFYLKEKEVFGIKMLNKIKNAIGVEGLQGLAKLFSIMNYHNILELQKFIKKFLGEGNNNQLMKEISSVIGLPFDSNGEDKELGKKYANAVSNIKKDFFKELKNKVVQIGQIELLRKMLNFSLSVNAEVDAYVLTSQIKSLNEINLVLLTNELKLKFDSDALPQNPRESTIGINKVEEINPTDTYYRDLCQLFEDLGYMDPQHTFYVDLSEELPLPVLLAACTYYQLNYEYSLEKGEKLVDKGSSSFDLYFFTCGIYSLLYQTGKNNIIFFISILSKILKVNILNEYSLKDFQQPEDNSMEVNKEVAMIQLFLQEFAYNCNIDLDFFGINFNKILMFRNMATK